MAQSWAAKVQRSRHAATQGSDSALRQVESLAASPPYCCAVQPCSMCLVFLNPSSCLNRCAAAVLYKIMRYYQSLPVGRNACCCRLRIHLSLVFC